ncbi:MAG: hypothetical protein ABSF55_03910 [Candidatus Staskawiczbacteria bacterium]
MENNTPDNLNNNNIADSQDNLAANTPPEISDNPPAVSDIPAEVFNNPPGVLNTPPEITSPPAEVFTSPIVEVKPKNKAWGIISVVVIILLLAGNIFLGIKYYLAEVQAQKVSSVSGVNQNVLTFEKLFVEKVLKTQGEVSYEDRLNLENAAANTKDSAIIDAWHNFLASATEADAQQKVLVLLSMFQDKIIH